MTLQQYIGWIRIRNTVRSLTWRSRRVGPFTTSHTPKARKETGINKNLSYKNLYLKIRSKLFIMYIRISFLNGLD